MPKKPVEVDPIPEPIEESTQLKCKVCGTTYDSIADTVCPNCGAEYVIRV